MHPMSQVEATDTPDNLLKVYAYFRACLSATLLIMYLSDMGLNVLGNTYPQIYLGATSAYLAISLLTLIYFHFNQSGPSIQLLFFMLLTDMVATTIIIHSSGGLSSGLGFLMLIIVAAGSILLTGRWSLLIAALASICILTETLSTTFLRSKNEETLFLAGVLGVLLFATALIFQILTRRIREAQSIASTRTAETVRLQALNESIVKRMRTGIIVVDGGDNIQLINSAAAQLLDQKQTSPLGIGHSLRTIHPLFKQLERWRSYPWLRTPTFKATASSQELQANFTPLYEEADRQVLIFLEDTRSLAQHAQQLKLSSLGRLTGSIAHEVRNPLGAISHASQLLSEQAVNDGQTKLLDIIHRHCGRVNQIVENVLQLSRQKPPAFQKLWLLQWLKKFRHEYLENQNKSDVIDIDNEGEDTQIFFDPSHLRQILVNLVDNGLRYSEQQTKQRWVKLVVSKDTSSGLPYLDIYDNGPGIPKQDQESIFEPFFTTSNEGSGLGLYLAQELCAVNYVSLSFIDPGKQGHYFRIGFAHPERLLPRPQE